MAAPPFTLQASGDWDQVNTPELSPENVDDPAVGPTWGPGEARGQRDVVSAVLWHLRRLHSGGDGVHSPDSESI